MTKEKMGRWCNGVAVAASLVMGGGVQAQPLSLPDAWRLALTGHPHIAQKQGSIGAAQDDGKQLTKFPK